MTADSPKACNAAFTASLLERDIEAAKALIAEDAVFFYSNGAAIAGRDAFAAMMTASWQVVGAYSYDSAGAAWVVNGADAAAVIYSFAWSGEARGQAVSGSGRATRVFRRDPQGWIVTHEHLSPGQFV